MSRRFDRGLRVAGFPLALLPLFVAAAAGAELVTFTGAHCDSKSVTVSSPGLEGSRYIMHLDRTTLVCPFVTRPTEYAEGVRVFLDGYGENTCTVRTVDPRNGTVFASQATHVVPRQSSALGLRTVKTPFELFVAHTGPAYDYATRALVCELPGLQPPSFLGNDGYTSELRSYTLEVDDLPPLSRIERFDDLEERFGTLNRDPGWALAFEESIQRLLDEAELALVRLACADVQCRIEIEASPEQALALEGELLGLEESTFRETARRRGKGDVHVVFVTRDGYQLSGERAPVPVDPDAHD